MLFLFKQFLYIELFSMKKIIIVSTDSRDIKKYELAEYLSEKFDLNIAISFITDTDITLPYTEYYEVKDVLLSYKNNALLYCLTDKNNIHTGISIDEFYNKDIFIMSIKGLLNIPEKKLNDSIIIWLDENINNIKELSDINDTALLINYLDNIEYMYFNESLDEVKNILEEYMNASDEEKNQIIKNNK